MRRLTLILGFALAACSDAVDEHEHEHDPVDGQHTHPATGEHDPGAGEHTHDHTDAGPHHMHVDAGAISPTDCTDPSNLFQPAVLFCVGAPDCRHLPPPTCVPAHDSPVPSCSNDGDGVVLGRWFCRPVADAGATARRCVSESVLHSCTPGLCRYNSAGEPECRPR